MKLYFYFLKEIKGKPCIQIKECEAEKKAKSYQLLGNVEEFYKSRVLKSEIGLHSGYMWQQYVILLKPDFAFAKQLFSDYLNGQIENKQKEIEKLQEKLTAIESMEG